MNADRKNLYRRPWVIAAAAGVFLASPIALLCGLQLSSFEFFTAVLTTVLMVWLVATIYASRGTFRVRSMLILMTIAGLICATAGRNAWKVEQQRLLFDRIKIKGGEINEGRGRKPQDGLFLTKGGLALPTWIMPVYERFTPKTVYSLTITPEFLTMENVNQLGLSQRRIAMKLLLDGTTGDPAAWSKLCEYSPLDEYEKRQVIADSLTQTDVDFLKSLPNREQLSLELNSPEKRDFELLKDLSLGVLSIMAMDRDPGAASAISELQSIQFWRFEKCKLGQSMESFLASLPAPKIFSAYQCVLTPVAMAAVASHNSLEQVGIYQCNFGDAEAKPFSQNANIVWLSFSGTTLSDTSLESFSHMEKLEKLHIFGSFCTWDGVRALCERTKLKGLMVDSATPPPGSDFQWHYLNDEDIEREILGRRKPNP